MKPVSHTNDTPAGFDANVRFADMTAERMKIAKLMTTAQHIVALLRSHIDGDDARFISVATQLAAHEARQGHGKLAQELTELIDAAKGKGQNVGRRGSGPVAIAQPRGELTNLLNARFSDTRLADMVLSGELKERLARVLTEQRQQERLKSRGLSPRRKLLLVGPPGSGKTMTAAALAGELKLPIFTVLYDGLIGKMMGETASRLRLVFDAMAVQRGVYFFDEFDAIGSQRSGPNDVGEIRRVLNSFLQFIENDNGPSLIIAATNHPELLDKAIFRRFDDVINYAPPDASVARGIIENHLATFDLKTVDWAQIQDAGHGLSQAEVARAADEAAKTAVLSDRNDITTATLLSTLAERKASTS
ncbi:ATPase family protein associated with various cellular activities (AAA) [Rhizobium sp. PP-F2F-G38]|nr:ATPase family protein associated with various cellular activities (AAA) [Rhizobium sp. PP-WC-1G-195]PYE93662.1 ATPase family protein associated with various cellular activities (AAA) [Rhizobium sp. PP-F2F-G38]TCQ25792.1 ATPase family protein associated with various cellular activities (AAA) [Rhizobium sp. PP-CC-3G-465]